MHEKQSTPNSKQKLFQDMMLGVLIYAVVLGFFNDYTNILYTKSYSTTFAVAVVMQLLTYATFMLKDLVVLRFKQKENSNKFALGFCIWLIIFLSKFVFLKVIDIIFGKYVEISGFIGIMLIIVCVTIVQKLVGLTYKKLGK